MYVPSHNRMDDRAEQLAFMRQYSFAALVSTGAGPGNGAALQATHLPFVVVEEGGALRLLAHQARANPQWRDFVGGGEVLVIFQGPHAYISPSLYQRQPSVPTWNYAAIHAYGSLRLLESREDKLRALRALVGANDVPYLAEMERLPEDFLALKLQGIVAFEIAVSRIEARWKLSQDRLPQERNTIVEALARSADSAALETAALTRKLDPAP
ncbi:MAG TPA: FMN-binding negative transcriptional regulator [Nevskia sp.]|nr:FMN-binding negative transcriptional regulator [Nevskia sp.]